MRRHNFPSGNTHGAAPATARQPFLPEPLAIALCSSFFLFIPLLQWYWELTIVKESGPSTVLAVGWVQRDYKFMDRVSLQQDTSERSWVIAAV